MVGGQQPYGGQAGLGEQFLGLGHATFRVLDRGRVVGRMFLLDEAGRRGSQVAHAGLGDLLVVQRVHDGLAVLHVVHRGSAAVEHREQQAEALLGSHGLGLCEGGQVGGRYRVDGLHGAGGERIGASGVVRDDLPLHLGRARRHRAVVGVVALEDDNLRAGAVVGHLVGARADRVQVEGLRVGLDGRLRNDLHHGQALGDQRERVLELDGDGGLVLGGDRVDEGDERGEQALVGGVHHTLEAEHDVGGGDRVAVGEDRAVTQRHLIGLVVDLLGQLGAERGVALAGGRMELGQALQSVPVHRLGERRGGGQRVVAVGTQLVADRGGDRPSLVGGAAPGRGAGGGLGAGAAAIATTGRQTRRKGRGCADGAEGREETAPGGLRN